MTTRASVATAAATALGEDTGEKRQPLNQCDACSLDFGSVSAHSAHRIGKHAYLFDYRDPSTWDGRRCLAESELVDLGWARDRFGRWRTPARKVSPRSAESPQRRSEPSPSPEDPGSGKSIPSIPHVKRGRRAA